jgi:hypothetical protein
MSPRRVSPQKTRRLGQPSKAQAATEESEKYGVVPENWRAWLSLCPSPHPFVEKARSFGAPGPQAVSLLIAIRPRTSLTQREEKEANGWGRAVIFRFSQSH